MKCVNDTFAPLERASVSLSAARLISSKRAATLRTLVAVGTLRLAFMLVTRRAAAPRNGVASLSMATDGVGVGADAFDAAAATEGTVERW